MSRKFKAYDLKLKVKKRITKKKRKGSQYIIDYYGKYIIDHTLDIRVKWIEGDFEYSDIISYGYLSKEALERAYLTFKPEVFILDNIRKVEYMKTLHCGVKRKRINL